MIKAYWDEIGFSFDENSSQENILFLDNYIWISNFKEMYARNLKKENLTTKIALEGLSLDDLNNESCILIPKNSLSGIQLDLRDTSSIFANEISVKNFKSLSSKTKIIIELSSMDDLAKLNKIKEYFPEHSELKIGFPDT